MAEAEDAVGAMVEHEKAEPEETKVDEAEPVEAEVQEAVVVMAEPEKAAPGETTLTTTYLQTRLVGIDLSSVDLDKVKNTHHSTAGRKPNKAGQSRQLAEPGNIERKSFTQSF